MKENDQDTDERLWFFSGLQSNYSLFICVFILDTDTD